LNPIKPPSGGFSFGATGAKDAWPGTRLIQTQPSALQVVPKLVPKAGAKEKRLRVVSPKPLISFTIFGRVKPI
jgi:hypothetical protein